MMSPQVRSDIHHCHSDHAEYGECHHDAGDEYSTFENDGFDTGAFALGLHFNLLVLTDCRE
jgi:hypothetical protein